MTHKKGLVREYSLFDTRAWHEGESTELRKWIGVGFFNHLFRSEKGLVTLYYDIDEANNFERALDKKLTEEFFDKLCHNFFELIDQEKDADTEEKVFNLSVKIWPALTIFDEISKYPDWATSSMLRRLIRVRTSTESFSYKLSKKVDHSKYPKDYLFFKGRLVLKPLNSFLEENNITIL
ncbi:hypothetical protein KAJ38_00450 [Candidatus Pacearchaeota archaeon]|nr:hypothetical protein [Candidatus Pacearchaeota archaeon]